MKRVVKTIVPFAIVVSAIALFAMNAAVRIETDPVSRTQYIMGTLVEIIAYGADPEPAIEAAFDRMREIEKQVGRDEDSDITRLNTQAGGMPVAVRPDTWNILALAKKYWEITEGAFDVTVGPLVDIWGFGYDGEGNYPYETRVREALPVTGSDKLALDPEARTARLARPGMAVTMGGIAKGYAVEEATRVLESRGIRNAMVNGGSSSIKVIGPGAPDRGWRVGIEDPRNDGGLLGVITLESGEAIGTSSDSRRYFIREGKRYTHIIDPRNGYPADKGIASVTVKTDDATKADILTKALFLNDMKWNLEYLGKLGIGAVFVGADGGISTAGGIGLEK